MSEMIDRVARVLVDLDWEGGSPINVYDDPETIARAAIAAMHEPSDSMIGATYKWSAWAGEERLRDAGLRAWKDAIDAALL